MKDLISKIKQPWDLWRMLRMAIAVIIAVDAWHSLSWGLLFFAAILAYQALWNVGCGASCATPRVSNKPKASTSTIDVSYEEVK